MIEYYYFLVRKSKTKNKKETIGPNDKQQPYNKINNLVILFNRLLFYLFYLCICTQTFYI